MSRRPPGGASSIIFGDEPVNYTTTAASPPAVKQQRQTSPSRRSPGQISQIFGNNNTGPTPPFTPPPKRAYGGLKNQSSLVLGDDSPSGGDSVAPVIERLAKASVDEAAAPAGYQPKVSEKRPTRPPGGKTSVALAWDENPQEAVTTPSPKKKMYANAGKVEERASRPGRRLYGDPGHRSQIDFAVPELNSSAPTTKAAVATPPRTPSPKRPAARPVADQSRTTSEQPVSIPPSETSSDAGTEAPAEETLTTPVTPSYGKSRPQSWMPSSASSLPDSSAEERPGKRYSHFRSSVVFGDDSPQLPDFSPRKAKPGKKLLTPPGGASVGSISDLAGGASEAAASSSSASSPRTTKARIDPATMTVAGATTGKHRVY
ncbi:hypothetical protein HK097_006950 [Rhizophlyctis rosea]|uniref:Uncharacterized protein n=1 Tax=Rhizophlyctis rosea TaxID=64517 RepID=A0AAD5X4Y6_9FUNG|nr:hypothetical protein HK097_006950 [Rhizophlyctis rosea]